MIPARQGQNGTGPSGPSPPTPVDQTTGTRLKLDLGVREAGTYEQETVAEVIKKRGSPKTTPFLPSLPSAV